MNGKSVNKNQNKEYVYACKCVLFSKFDNKMIVLKSLFFKKIFLGV